MCIPYVSLGCNLPGTSLFRRQEGMGLQPWKVRDREWIHRTVSRSCAAKDTNKNEDT